jgi:integrase
MWEAVSDERVGNFVKLMLTTGLRPGEALGLCWDSVDLDAATLTVRRAVRLERGKARLVDEVKTKASYRTIGLAAPAVEVLRAQRRAVAETKLAARMWTVDDPGLVFPTATGPPWNLANVRHELYRVCDTAGLPRVRPHELRHTAASVLSDRGVPLELIADLLGHVDVTMVSHTYRHRVRPSVDAAVDVMNSVFGT